MSNLVRCLVAVLLLSGGLASAQNAAQLEQAKHEFDTGQTAYNLAQYEVALVHYTKAYELAKLPAILFNLAQVRRKLYEQKHELIDLREARELYRSYLRQVPISSDRQMAESLLAEVEGEYTRQLHAQRDKLLAETKGAAALGLAEDFLAQNDLEAAKTAHDRFVHAPGNHRSDVARALRVKARLEAAGGDERASELAWARALSLDPATAPPPESDPQARVTFQRAQERMKGKAPLQLSHVPPGRLKIGQAPKLRFDTTSDPLGMIHELSVSYRAGVGAYAHLSVRPGEMSFPPEFNNGLSPGTRVEYHVDAIDEEGGVVDSLGSDALPFVLQVDARPPKPVWKRWQFWVGLGAGVVAAGAVAATVGVMEGPPPRTAIPVTAPVLTR
jgi:tetratricopeptide (TPR) repeat protein